MFKIFNCFRVEYVNLETGAVIREYGFAGHLIRRLIFLTNATIGNTFDSKYEIRGVDKVYGWKVVKKCFKGETILCY